MAQRLINSARGQFLFISTGIQYSNDGKMIANIWKEAAVAY
jgi:hypothetical protein